MSLDLAHPRALIPLVPPDEPAPSAASGSASHARSSGPDGASERTPTPRARTAVHLRLTEEVLAQLVELAKKGPAGVPGGSIQVDFGAHPALLVNGVPHPLSLHPEAPHTELVRLTPASRDLNTVAAVTHKGSVQHSKADLEKAAHRARENRELAEKEKDSRRAVLLDSAPSASHSRSNSLNRAAPSRPHTPLSAALGNGSSSAPSSRTASPAGTARHPSRLTAVPPKPPTGTTFRIGKGAAPSSTALSRTSTSSSSSSEQQGAAKPKNAEKAPGSSPRPAPTAAPAPAPAARQASASSASSSSSEQSLLQQTTGASTSGASVTSPESLPFPLATAATNEPASAAAPAPEPSVAEKGKSLVRAGGGGVLKGKDSLRKEKRRDERAKDRASAGAATAPPGAKDEPLAAKRKEAVPAPSVDEGGDEDAEGEEEDAPGEIEEEQPRAAKPPPPSKKAEAAPSAPKKKRRLDADERDAGRTTPAPASGASSRASSSSRPSAKPIVTTKVVTKVVSTGARNGRASDRAESGSDAPPSRKSSLSSTARREGDKRRARPDDSDDSSPPLSEVTAAGGRSKKKKRVKEAKTERWYSSSSEEDERESAPVRSAASSRSRPPPSAAVEKDKRRSGAAATPSTSTVPLMGSPLRKSTSFAASASALPTPTAPPVTLTSREDFAPARLRFLEAYAQYAMLHSRLAEARFRLERGERALEGLDQVKRLVRELGQHRAELEALREGMRRFVEQTAGREGA
ncbi:uncharacterized protein JCM10292_000553 [Rhodotorula paludigena]|uniref:uncharacterized protein n=1 Tax=Rhodotorula paludigena TaxID=86838 RepID=UPI00317C177D